MMPPTHPAAKSQLQIYADRQVDRRQYIAIERDKINYYFTKRHLQKEAKNKKMKKMKAMPLLDRSNNVCKQD